jgi:hypothetical protein
MITDREENLRSFFCVLLAFAGADADPDAMIHLFKSVLGFLTPLVMLVSLPVYCYYSWCHT